MWRTTAQHCGTSFARCLGGLPDDDVVAQRGRRVMNRKKKARNTEGAPPTASSRSSSGISRRERNWSWRRDEASHLHHGHQVLWWLREVCRCAQPLDGLLSTIAAEPRS